MNQTSDEALPLVIGDWQSFFVECFNDENVYMENSRIANLSYSHVLHGEHGTTLTHIHLTQTARKIITLTPLHHNGQKIAEAVSVVIDTGRISEKQRDLTGEVYLQPSCGWHEDSLMYEISSSAKESTPEKPWTITYETPVEEAKQYGMYVLRYTRQFKDGILSLTNYRSNSWGDERSWSTAVYQPNQIEELSVPFNNGKDQAIIGMKLGYGVLLDPDKHTMHNAQMKNRGQTFYEVSKFDFLRREKVAEQN